jgi:hypothetical protein
MWFSIQGDIDWIKVSIDRVKHVLSLNAKEEFPYSLESDHEPKTESRPNNQDLLALDSKYKKTKRKKKRPPKKRSNEK